MKKIGNDKKTITYPKYLFRKLVFKECPLLALGMSIGRFIYNDYFKPGLLKELIVPIISEFIVYYIVALPFFLLIPISRLKKYREKYDKLYKN